MLTRCPRPWGRFNAPLTENRSALIVLSARLVQTLAAPTTKTLFEFGAEAEFGKAAGENPLRDEGGL